MLKKISTFAVSFLLSIGSLFVLAPMVAHAATVTWSGASGTDTNWSTAGNWVGGVVPTNGDSVVIDNSATFTAGNSTDDINGLSLAGITFTNNAASGVVSILLTENLTVTGPITQAASVTTTGNAISSTGGARTLTLGGNVIVSSNTILNILNTGDTLALGGNTLTFNETTTGGSLVAIDANITGSGSIIYDAPNTEYQIHGNNTYSGTTHVMATNTNGLYKGIDAFNPFGTSDVTIEAAASVSLTFDATTTISNNITITGTTSGSPVTSLGFSDGGANSVVLTVPNITLNGDTRFANNGTGSPALVINLAGITDNDHCVEYLGPGTAEDGPSNGFTNGPAGCLVDADVADPDPVTTPAPKAPDTGFALVKNNPIVTFIATLALAGAMIVIARRVSKANR